MSVRPKVAAPKDPQLVGVWREFWAGIRKAKKALKRAGVDMSVDIRITQRKR